MKLMGKKILVEQMLTKDESAGGIALPESSRSALPMGKVMGTGPDVLVKASGIKEGDVILFSEIGAIPLFLKENHVLIEPEDVLAILEEGEY